MGIVTRFLGDPTVDRHSSDRLLLAGRTPARRVYVLPSPSKLDLEILSRSLRRLGLEPGSDGREEDRILTLGSDPSLEVARLEDLLAVGSPIVFCPCLVVWDVSFEQSDARFRRLLLGRHDRPTRLRRFLDVALRNDPELRVGPALDPRDERLPSPRRRARWMRAQLLRRLRAERRVISGPLLPSRTEIRHGVLESASALSATERLAKRLHLSVPTVRRRMAGELRALSARLRYLPIVFLWWFLRFVWTRIYEGVEVPPEDLERIRQASRRGAVILLPSHRSHLDYLLLSWVLFVHRIQVPHIVAGDNLNVPLIGPLLRRCGALFIKRSFRDEEIFSTVFDRYLGELIRRDLTVEVFIEGSRSRSGRMLPPRPGVLRRILDAAASHRRGHEVTLLPVAITYERVAEAGTFAREQQGAPKEPESLSAILRARRVLDQRYGRVALRIGDPLVASRIVDGGDGTRPWSVLDEAARETRVTELGREICWRISRAQVVLAPHLVALALAAAPSTVVRLDDLKARTLRFREVLRRCRARLGPEIDRVDAGLAHVQLQFEERGWLAKQDADRWRIEPTHRIDLELLSGPALGFFAEVGLAALAAEGFGVQRFGVPDLVPLFDRLREVLSGEITLPPGAGASSRSGEPIVRDGLRILAATGALRRSSEGYEQGSVGRLAEIVRLFRPMACGHLAFYLELPLVLRAKPEISANGIVHALLADRRSVERRWGLPPGSILRSTLENARRTARQLGVMTEADDRRIGVDERACQATAHVLADCLGIVPSQEPETHPDLPARAAQRSIDSEAGSTTNR